MNDGRRCVPYAECILTGEQEFLDSTIQQLYGLGLGLEECLHLVDDTPVDAKTRLDSAISSVGQMIDRLRGHMETLGVR